jgi:hypothetical protein
MQSADEDSPDSITTPSTSGSQAHDRYTEELHRYLAHMMHTEQLVDVSACDMLRRCQEAWRRLVVLRAAQIECVPAVSPSYGLGVGVTDRAIRAIVPNGDSYRLVQHNLDQIGYTRWILPIEHVVKTRRQTYCLYALRNCPNVLRSPAYYMLRTVGDHAGIRYNTAPLRMAGHVLSLGTRGRDYVMKYGVSQDIVAPLIDLTIVMMAITGNEMYLFVPLVPLLPETQARRSDTGKCVPCSVQ